MCCNPWLGTHAIKKCEQYWLCACKHNIKARPCKNSFHGKAILILYSQFVSVALVLQYSTSMLRVILSFVTCLGATTFFRIIS
jgi:hypothetical protein